MIKKLTERQHTRITLIRLLYRPFERAAYRQWRETENVDDLGDWLNLVQDRVRRVEQIKKSRGS